MFMMFILSSMLESCMLGLILVMLNLVQNLNLQLSIFTTMTTKRNNNSHDYQQRSMRGLNGKIV